MVEGVQGLPAQRPSVVNEEAVAGLLAAREEGLLKKRRNALR